MQKVAMPDGRFQFQKRSQHFFGAHDETLFVAMRVHNADRSPFGINFKT